MATPYIYTVNGKKFASDEPLTQAELNELKAKVGGAPAAPKPAPATPPPAAAAPKGPQEPAGIFEYLLNAAKRGVTGTTSATGTGYEAGSEMSRKLQEMEERSRREKMGPRERLEMFRQSGYFPSLAELAEKYGQQQRTAARVTGARDLTAPGPVTEIIGAGIEAMSDPLGLVGKAKLVPVVKKAIGEFTTGTAADVGGRSGAAVEQYFTEDESGLGRVAGALLGGGATAAKRETISNLAEQAAPVVSRGLEKVKQVIMGGTPSETEQKLITGAAKRLLDFAAQEQGAKSIDDILKEASEASRFVTGADAPLLVAMADNPVIRQQVIRLAKTDPAFRQQVNDTLAGLKGDMRSKVEKIFGSRYEAKGAERSVFEPDYKPGKQPTSGLDIGNVAKRREVLSQRIEDIASGFEPTATKEDIGSRIESLIEDKKRLARQEVSPDYEKLLSEARASGVKMPVEGVEQIYQFVRQNNLRDIFGKGTKVDSDIMKFLSPKEFPVPGTGETVLEHIPISFDNVESLKKAINGLKRQRMSEDSMRKVMQLEEIVDAARESIPGNFSQRLNDIDLKYYQKVGVPFGAQGVKDIDSKTYATQVAPVILKSTESFNQFVRAAGKEEGFKVAEDSIISDIYDKVIEDGVIKPSKLAKYIKTKEGIINQIPGLREKLTTALIDDSQVRARIDALDDAANAAQKRIADNALTKFDAPNYNALARSFMADPGARTKLLRDIGDLDADSAKAVRRTLRAEVIDLADNNPSGFINYLMDPKNKDALDQIFGSAFQPALRKVGLLADKVSQADISKVGMSVGAEKLDVLEKQVKGASVPGVMSVMRDRIMSLPQKVAVIMSRINAAKLSGKTDEAIKELLLDPNGVQKLSKVAADIDFSVDAAGRVKKLASAVADVMPRAFYTSGKTALAAEERELRAKERQRQVSEDIFVGGFEEGEELPPEPPPAEEPAPTPVPREETAAPRGYSFEDLTPEQKERLQGLMSSTRSPEMGGGLNPEFLLNAQTFNATPVEKRRELFRLLAMNQRAHGGMVKKARGGYTLQEELLLKKYDRGGSVSRPTLPADRYAGYKEDGDEEGKLKRFLEAAIRELPAAIKQNVTSNSDLAAKYLKFKFGTMSPDEAVMVAKALPEGLKQTAAAVIQTAKEAPRAVAEATPESAGRFAGQMLAGEMTDPMRVTRAAKAATKPVASAVGPYNPKPMPVLEVDNPGGDWLKEKKEISDSMGFKASGAPVAYGRVTGVYNDKVYLPVSLLKKIPGENQEQLNVRERDLNWLVENMGKTNSLPKTSQGTDYAPFITVDQRGRPFMSEGNHRVMAADKLGWEWLPVEIRYFNGSEQVDGPLSPKKIEDLLTEYANR